MMRRRRWWISVAILGIIGLVGLCPKSVRGVNENEPVDSLLVRDTIPLPSLAYSMRVGGDTLTLPDSCALWDSFFDALDSLRAGKDTIIHIVHLGDSHIQAGYYSGKTMRLLHATFGNAGRGFIAPLKLNRTNEPADYFIRSTVREWTAGRITQHRKRGMADI